MLSTVDIQTPEMASWVRDIVTPLIQEQMDVLRKEIREDDLRHLERSLAAMEKRTEKRFDRLETAIAELAEAQKHTEERVTELAEAQKHTEKQVAQLTATQRRVLERLDKLDHRVGGIDHRLGLIGNVLGIEAEGEAEETLVYILEQKGYQLLEAPYALAVDDIEIDIVVSAETPDEETISVLVDVKARARLKELRRWFGRLQDLAFQQRLIDAGVEKPFLPYLFGLRVYQIVDDEARRLDIGVLDPNGERVEPALIR